MHQVALSPFLLLQDAHTVNLIQQVKQWAGPDLDAHAELPQPFLTPD